jgi:antitoxin VapB
MALSIKHPDADRLARQLAARTGETLTDAIINALRERLRREQGRVRGPRLRDELRAIRQRCAALPVKDRRSADEILGYDEAGMPH